jgi:hypothetical protein
MQRIDRWAAASEWLRNREANPMAPNVWWRMIFVVNNG